MRKPAYVLFFVNLFVIVFFWWKSSSLLLGSNPLIAFGRLAGLLAVFFVLMQFMLIGRAAWIERSFGLDKLSRVHRLNGYLSLSFILLHPLLITMGYARVAGLSPFQQFLGLIKNTNLLLALFAVIIFLIVVTCSIYIVRKKLPYELWYFVHLFTYLAIILAWWHQLAGGDFSSKAFAAYWYGLYAFVFGNLLLFRFLRPLYLFGKHHFSVSDVVRETSDVVSIYISGKDMAKFRILPGKFIILRFLSTRFWWQAHPFSLSKLPDGRTLRVTIKNCGDFTSQVGEVKKGTPVIIDGPYGRFTADSSTQRDKFLLIAGGIGITPIMALAAQLCNKDAILLYANKSSDAVFKKDIDNLASHSSLKVRYFISSSDGRLNGEKIKQMVPDFTERDVFICGPVQMMDDIMANLKKLGSKPDLLHFERFSL